MNAPLVPTGLCQRPRLARGPAFSFRPSSPRPERRDCQGRLAALLIALGGEGASLAESSRRPWCSATFVGAQHRLVLRFEGTDAAAQCARFAAALPEAELTLPGHIVADAVIDASRSDGEGWIAELAILTVEDW